VEIRYQVAEFKSFEFETANVKAKVINTEMSLEADGKLEAVWVKAYKEEVVQTRRFGSRSYSTNECHTSDARKIRA
jgi:hypothetical protein